MSSLGGSSSKPSILCFSSSDWYGRWGSRQQVMLRFARRGYRVLFFEQPAGLEHLLRYPDLRRRKLRRWREGLRSVVENLWIASLPPLLPGRYYNMSINRINQWLTAACARHLQSGLGFTSSVLWLYNPEQGPLIGSFGERLSVYHCIDEFAAGTRGRKRRIITALEARLLRRVDLVFANSLLTYERKRSLHSQTYRIPSGADVGHLARAMDEAYPVHPSIAYLRHPVAGYVGNVNAKIDINLLAAVANRLADWQFVFVGRVYPQAVDLGPLSRLPNVHFLGRFPFAEVPALMRGMDVCLLPYADTEHARYRSPLKLYEYLAAGKPVVSTEHPEVREFSAWVDIASTPSEYAAAIVRARERDTPERRQRRAQIARKHSWDRRVDEMERLVTARLANRHAR
jgi:glycosyltransferase involved in cell wall biosynthesis